MLFDYGLCIPLDDAATCNNGNTLEGSPFYLPPERVVGAPEGEYSEIYSLGMVMFHMLSGHTYYSRSAFSADKVKSLLLKHVKSPRLSSVGVSLRNTSPEMINLLDRMLARFPNERYPDFLSLKMELERIYGPKEHDRLLRNIVYFEMVSIIIIVSTALLIIYIKKNPLFMSFFDALPF